MTNKRGCMRLLSNRILPALALLSACAFGVRGATATYDISIDTGSIAGQVGGIYLGFFPGLTSDSAAVKINNFVLTAPGMLAGGATTDGAATGALDTGNLALSNTFALNDYLEGLTFGNKLSFQVVFSLPNTLTGSSGSEFDLELTGPDLLTPLLTSAPSGNIVTISYDQNGRFSSVSNSVYAQATSSSASPEPPVGSLTALSLALGALGFARSNRWPLVSKTLRKPLKTP